MTRFTKDLRVMVTIGGYEIQYDNNKVAFFETQKEVDDFIAKRLAGPKLEVVNE